MTGEVNWKFAIPITPDSDGEVGTDLLFDGPVSQVEKEESALQKKLNSIIIPRIDFDNVSIASAIKNLSDQSRRLDPERLGVNIVLRTYSDSSLNSQDGTMGPDGMPLDPAFNNPNNPAGKRWIHNFKWRNTALNFGVGYPF